MPLRALHPPAFPRIAADPPRTRRAPAADPPRLDARPIHSPNGYYLPVANYQRRVGDPARLRVRVDRPIRQVTSAYHGKVAASHDDGWVSIDLPALGYGDVLRLDP